MGGWSAGKLKKSQDVGPVDGWSSRLDRVICPTYIQQNPGRNRKSQATSEKGSGSIVLRHAYKLEETQSMKLQAPQWKGPKREASSKRKEHHWAQLLHNYQWNKDEEDIIEKKKQKFIFYFSNVNNTCR